MRVNLSAMNNEVFLRPRLRGARFADHAIPLEVLEDLAVLAEMLIEIAKAQFLKDHPERKRSPRGFTEGIELKLTAVEDGSAIPVIKLFVLATNTLFPSDKQVYLERARDSLVSAIGAAESNQPITVHLPERTLSYFDRLGRSLRDGEAIEFTSPTHPSPVSLTKETRRKLLFASSAMKELTEETSVRGSVPEADQDKMSFQVQLASGQKVVAPIFPQHLDAILDAFNGYRGGTRVLLKGVGRFDRKAHLLALESIEHVSILDPLDIHARLDELRGLKAGWLAGQGEVLRSDALDWLAQNFDERYSDDLRPPFLYPTPEGGVQAEWSQGTREVTLEIDLSSHKARWHELDVETDTEESRDLNLDAASDWTWLSQQVGRLTGAES